MAKTFKGHSPFCGDPEQRRGTRTHKGYMRYCASDMPGGMTAALAKPRQWQKALKLAQGDAPKASQVQGRVIRACLRAVYAEMGEWADDQIYGGP